MEYGQGGTTGGYNSHTAGTGGYAKVIMKSDTEFSDYEYTMTGYNCKAIQDYNIRVQH